MHRQAWRSSLRGIKLFILIVAILVVSLFNSVIFSRPASAESFLYRTVKCVTTLFIRCDSVTQRPGVRPPVQTPTPTTAPAEAAGAEEGATPTQTPSTTSQTAAPLVTPPLDSEFKEVTRPAAPAPELPRPTHRMPFTYSQSTYLANMYGGDARGGVVAALPESVPARATPDGWYVFGVAWYWWMAGVIALAGIGYAARRVYYKKNHSIAK